MVGTGLGLKAALFFCRAMLIHENVSFWTPVWTVLCWLSCMDAFELLNLSRQHWSLDLSSWNSSGVSPLAAS
jgi:hypothetical protein